MGKIRSSIDIGDCLLLALFFGMAFLMIFLLVIFLSIIFFIIGGGYSGYVIYKKVEWISPRSRLYSSALKILKKNGNRINLSVLRAYFHEVGLYQDFTFARMITDLKLKGAQKTEAKEMLKKLIKLEIVIIHNKKLFLTSELNISELEINLDKPRQKNQQDFKKIYLDDFVEQPAPVEVPIVKKYAALKKTATAGQGASNEVSPTVVNHPRSRPATRGQPREKSKFAPRATDTATIVNRTVLKDYIERQRKAGNKELHFIKIKNDLNVISQEKSSRLYRLLQELVKDSVLVRKGSLYIVV